MENANVGTTLQQRSEDERSYLNFLPQEVDGNYEHVS
jgi:hypothetical protein